MKPAEQLRVHRQLLSGDGGKALASGSTGKIVYRHLQDGHPQRASCSHPVSAYMKLSPARLMQLAACAQAAADRGWWQGAGPREHGQNSVPPPAGRRPDADQSAAHAAPAGHDGAPRTRAAGRIRTFQNTIFNHTVLGPIHLLLCMLIEHNAVM